ncbi:MAG: STAS domain-containing protein [Candidatus Eremiobacteraeota bacterium]|nr:STAS domain-containing protein [Candidatus Eremiobacteraeota bacterium]
MESIVIEFQPHAYSALEEEVVSAFQAIGEDPIRVVLSLDHLDSLDNQGVRGLIALLRRSRSLGGELALRATKPNVRRTLEVTALDRLFPMEEAEAA